MPTPGIIDTLERVQQRNSINLGERGEPAAPKEMTCLLSPLAFMSSPTIDVGSCRKRWEREMNTSGGAGT